MSTGTPYNLPLYVRSRNCVGLKRAFRAAVNAIGASFPLLAPVGTQSFPPTTISGPDASVALSKASLSASKLENVTTFTV